MSWPVGARCGGATPWLLVSSFLWHLTRWDGLFLGTYLVTDLGAPPIANQFVGVAMFAPMLLGAYAGRWSTSSRRLIGWTMVALLPVSVVMTVLVAAGVATAPMVYPYELALGFGGMVNMTAQRELLFRMGGPQRGTRVINTEVTGMATAMMLGPLIGGATIDAIGLGVAFAIPAALLAISALMFWLSTRRPLPEIPGPVGVPAPGGDNRGLLRRSRPLVVILLVTVVCNLCYFAFLPLIPVIAKYLGAGAAMAGVIGATAGVVQLAVAAVLVVRPVRRPLAAYAGGVALCLCCLGALACMEVVGAALLVLAVAGIGQALFGSAQATLPVTAVAPHERTAALGLVTTTIGVALPSGMVVLGIASSLLGARQAMLVSALVGLIALCLIVIANAGLFGARRRRIVSRRAVGVGGESHPIAAQPELG